LIDVESAKMANRLLQLGNHLIPPADLTRIDGQVVLITGAAQGTYPSNVKETFLIQGCIGIRRAVAELLALKGAKIAINDLDEKKAKVAVKELQAAGHDAFCYCGDILEVEFPLRLIKAVIERFGRIIILINNAGMGRS
jgi:3-oxoacyl-[acyl-carrier protein] reductase